jgi:hypothetical protein
MRTIDADKFILALMDASLSSVDEDTILDLVDSIPTVDAVVVTRCKDCVHWNDDPDTYGADDGPKGKCMKSFETMCADDFCSYGERKDGGDG